jgi:hypothetical protein
LFPVDNWAFLLEPRESENNFFLSESDDEKKGFSDSSANVGFESSEVRNLAFFIWSAVYVEHLNRFLQLGDWESTGFNKCPVKKCITGATVKECFDFNGLGFFCPAAR